MTYAQVSVVAASALAAISVGAAVTYPSVLLQQLSANDTSIHMDFDTASWIGSIHGLAGIPSLLMPTLMQWKGRKVAFIIACLINLLGWILAFSATDTMTILISESCHGLGNNSILGVVLLSMSEMMAPKFRNLSMIAYYLSDGFGRTLSVALGNYLHWKTISWLFCIPISIAVLLGLLWPQSPPWLAYKGMFEQCEKAFTSMRGVDDESKKELSELIRAQKEKNPRTNRKNISRFSLDLRSMLKRDFYLPGFHIFLLIGLPYLSGYLVILIYTNKLAQTTTENEYAAFFGGILANLVIIIAGVISAVLVRRYQNKSVMILSAIFSVICLLASSLSIYLQTIEILSKDSVIGTILLVLFAFFESLGVVPVGFSVAAELMPVKHRGVGGALYVFICCILHAATLKIAPYLFIYMSIPGTLLLYAANATIFVLYIWKCVPETKGRTLQEIENFYTNGNFVTGPSLQAEPLVTLRNTFIE